MKLQIILIIFSLILYFAGCSDNTTSVNNNNVYNVRVTNDTLSVNAVTTNFTNSQDVDLYFSVDTVKLNLGVTGYASGSGTFQLLKDTSVIYTKDLNTNIQSVQQLITPKPTIAKINFSNYKGTVAILVTK